jgi:5'-nucleotidase
MMMQAALDQIGVRHRQTAMVGDRMDTDILGGLQANMYTLLVLSGVTTLDDLEHRLSFRPDLILDDVGQLAN